MSKSKSWKHKKLGFIVTNVEFIQGWAKFINNSIEDFMDEENFKRVYEEI